MGLYPSSGKRHFIVLYGVFLQEILYTAPSFFGMNFLRQRIRWVDMDQ